MSDRERRLEEIQRIISARSSQFPEGCAERLSGQFARMMADDAWKNDDELPSLIALEEFLSLLERDLLLWARNFGIGTDGCGSITAFWREGDVRYTVNFSPTRIRYFSSYIGQEGQ
jgi:hypothetical protein